MHAMTCISGEWSFNIEEENNTTMGNNENVKEFMKEMIEDTFSVLILSYIYLILKFMN
jgi:hypothetical protein